MVTAYIFPPINYLQVFYYHDGRPNVRGTPEKPDKDLIAQVALLAWSYIFRNSPLKDSDDKRLGLFNLTKDEKGATQETEGILSVRGKDF